MRYAVAIGYIVLALQVSRLNLEASARMSEDPAVLAEYSNDDYSICHHVGRVAAPGQRVYIYNPDGHWSCPSEADKGWLYPGLDLEIHPTPGYDLNQNRYTPGDLVVVGTRSRGLREEELAKLEGLADETGSSDSLRTSLNIAGRTSVASICVERNRAGHRSAELKP
jgi:hypothetical protein